jgi:hypothetical protein
MRPRPRTGLADMAFKYKKHYTVEEAREMLPQLRKWLDELNRHRRRVAQLDQRLEQLLAAGDDLGGDSVNEWIKNLTGIQKNLARFQKRDIQIKDLERGLVDFPAVLGGKEVFLCWEQDEDDIEYWHDLDTGYSGRERLPEA